MRQSQEGRALRQFTLSTGKSAGRNSSGKTKRSGLFKRMGGALFSLGMEVYFLYLRRRWIRAIISFLFFHLFSFSPSGSSLSHPLERPSLFSVLCDCIARSYGTSDHRGSYPFKSLPFSERTRPGVDSLGANRAQ